LSEFSFEYVTLRNVKHMMVTFALAAHPP
jgi:hypothetical protein